VSSRYPRRFSNAAVDEWPPNFNLFYFFDLQMRLLAKSLYRLPARLQRWKTWVTLGHERPFCDVRAMSAYPSTPDVMLSAAKRRSGLCVDIEGTPLREIGGGHQLAASLTTSKFGGVLPWANSGCLKRTMA
jgi:hypothetical protein